MRPIPISLACALLGLAAAPLAAAPTKPAAARPGGAKPTGDVTRAQMLAEVEGVFALTDTNKDGFMSRAEFAKRMGVVLNRTPPGSKNAPTAKQAQEMLDAANAAFKAVDSNNDGRLSRAEASRRPMRAFDMVDANHDGVLTVAEKLAARRPGAGAVPDRKLAPGR